MAHRPLRGGVSAAVHLIELVCDGRSDRKVVRWHEATEVKPREVSARTTLAVEFAAMSAARQAGLPVPKPLLLDTSGEVLPWPYLVMDFVEGTADVEPLARAIPQLAGLLAHLHRLPLSTELRAVVPPREAPDPPGLEVPPQENGAALLHGDFWPGNVLWRDGEIAAVLDWEDAALGDPLSDLAAARLELFWAFGAPAMEAFTSAYLRANPLDLRALPAWEVYIASAAATWMGSWGLSARTERERRRKTAWFMEEARRRARP